MNLLLLLCAPLVAVFFLLVMLIALFVEAMAVALIYVVGATRIVTGLCGEAAEPLRRRTEQPGARPPPPEKPPAKIR